MIAMEKSVKVKLLVTSVEFLEDAIRMLNLIIF